MFRTQTPTAPTAATESSTRVEFAARITWPDGHSETYPEANRYDADAHARRHAFRDPTPASAAEVVTRQITATAWAAPR